MARLGTLLLLLLLAAGCAAIDDAEGGPERPSRTPPENTGVPPETPGDLRVERVAGGAPGQGPRSPRVIVAPSAAGLSREIGTRVPESGGGAYLAAYWGRKSTGGYALAVESARVVEGDKVEVRLSLEEPPPGAILTQALTHPYVVVAVRGLDPRGVGFVFEDQGGRDLDWPVSRTGG